MSSTRLLFFSAGEPSGDVHAAGLIAALKRREPGVEITGFGGPKMEAAGAQLLSDMTRLAVMWFGRAAGNYFRFKRLLREAERFFSENSVEAVVLVDYPGFNWHIARAAKKHGIPVFYFMPPQVWAWAQWRTKKMRALVDLTLCPLDFEESWFSRHGINAKFIGHPFFEENRKKAVDQAFLESFFNKMTGKPILTLLPGSRMQEIAKNLDDMLRCVARVRERVPCVQPVFAAFSDEHAERIAELTTERPVDPACPVDPLYPEVSIPVYVDRTAELIRAADCCLAVSGSVSLELLACNKPTVIYYRVGAIPFFIQRFFRRARYITLVNLLAADRAARAKKTAAAPSATAVVPGTFCEKENPDDGFLFGDALGIIPAHPTPQDQDGMLFPEFLTADDKSRQAADHLIEWLTKPESLAQRKRELAALLEAVDTVPHSLDVAAESILSLAAPFRQEGQC